MLLPAMGFSWKPPPIVNSILKSRVLVEGVFGTARNRRFLSWHVPTSSIENWVSSPSKGLIHRLAYRPQPLGLKQRAFQHRIQLTAACASNLALTRTRTTSAQHSAVNWSTATTAHRAAGRLECRWMLREYFPAWFTGGEKNSFIPLKPCKMCRHAHLFLWRWRNKDKLLFWCCNLQSIPTWKGKNYSNLAKFHPEKGKAS